MFNSIYDPNTKLSYNINSILGKKTILKYINNIEQYSKPFTGGHLGPCSINSNGSGRCVKSNKSDGNCELNNGRCRKKLHKKSIYHKSLINKERFKKLENNKSNLIQSKYIVPKKEEIRKHLLENKRKCEYIFNIVC